MSEKTKKTVNLHLYDMLLARGWDPQDLQVLLES